MPELPEVEIVARNLRKTIAGKQIEEVCLSGKALRRPVPGDFATKLKGKTIREITRRGKYLIVEMEPHTYWLIHLGMSGRLLYLPKPSERPPHTHAAIRFADGGELQYRDPRRFGLMSVCEAAGIVDIPEIQALGCDPLSSDFNSKWLCKELKQSRREIKAFLLDQHLIAGLGNIYVCEALFRCGLHPSMRCNRITNAQAAALADGIQSVLRAAISHRGTSFSDFLDSDGRPGGHQGFLQVFQKEGEKCRRCGAIIRRIRQGNRSSYYCPCCQKSGRRTIGKKG